MSSFYKSIQPEDIPRPSESHLRLIELCSQESVEVDELTQVISADPVVSTKVIALVNSSIYNFSQSIESLQHAVVALGVDVVKNLALCFAIKESFPTNEELAIDEKQFWQDALYRAVATEVWVDELSESEVGSNERSLAFTCGLLAEIGVLALFTIEPHKADRWSFMRMNAPDHRLSLEQELFNTEHTQVSKILLKQWQLPDSYSEVIACHHDNAPAALMSLALSKADWTVSLIRGFNVNHCLNHFSTKEQKLLETILEKVNVKVQEVAQVLNFGTVESQDYSQLIQSANQALANANVSFQELTWKLQSALKERDEFAERLRMELTIAREIQQSLQSDTSYREHVAAINIPAKTLSGDFFDYYEHHDGNITFCLGDVSGKGTHAALVMAKTISLYRCLSKVESNLEKVVRLINDEIFETSVRGMFVTFVAGRVNLNTCSLELVNAGHIPPLQVGANSVKQIEAHGPPLGVVDGFEYQSQQVEFSAHRLYLYTDGITEAKKPDGNDLGTKEFVQWILMSKRLPLKDQLEWLGEKFLHDVVNWQDDLTMMILSSKCGY